ncbi:hypothetical protein MM239_07120 [Belliella sp. DSM 111904]|uniref:Uncharacterized protein n=1 Tax=Belliella filtrata TaxID=2923435 RepID=A0ABS9UYC0_9BACT|nr:hypothetical protein [Belliella filtrata]MCH7409158.1 hypothetical protein [Belliella filtrata]
MGEVFKEPAARRELFDLGEADEYKEDINYSLKKLLDVKENPYTRQSSAIVNAFYANVENHRIMGDDGFSEQELIEFINTNNISMLAPYMIGYFEPESIKELTMSWWTEEMEKSALKDNPEWKGETPAVKLRLDERGNFIQFKKSGINYFTNELIYVNDSYAISNPTVVLGSFHDDRIDIPIDGDSMIGGNIIDYSLNTPYCEDLTSSTNEIVVLRAPELQLDGNIRNWPNANYIHMWVATGSFEVDSNGIPKINSSVNYPIADLKVVRSDAKNRRWVSSQTSFIISNWKFDSQDAYIVWGSKKTSANIDVTGTVSASSGTSGNTGSLSVKVAFQSKIELVSAMSYDKCFVLKNNRDKIIQNNLPLRNRVPVYKFGKINSYFEVQKL